MGLIGVRHGAYLVSLALGVLVMLASLWLWPRYAVAFGVNAMFLAYLAQMAMVLPRLTPAFLKAKAAEADMPVAFIVFSTLALVAVSFYGLFAALNAKGGPAYDLMALSILSVLSGWFAVHTMAAMHYAYEYYEAAATPHGRGKMAIAGGLDFPGGEEPDGADFLYFGYVIGIAFAVSDVQARSRKMRRILIVHSVFAYFFNTLIMAATVNAAVAVGGT